MKLIMMKDICGRIKPNLPFQGDVGRYVAILPEEGAAGLN